MKLSSVQSKYPTDWLYTNLRISGIITKNTVFNCGGASDRFVRESF